MPRLISELIVSLDSFARGQNSPGYYGYLGPEFEGWLKANNDKPHRKLIGRKTYELLNALPKEARDDGWKKTAATPGYLFSRTLREVEWPGLKLVNEDLVEFVRALKGDDGPELRVLGSLSVARQLAEAKLLDCMRLMVCPLVVPQSGVEPVFEGWQDTGFELAASEVLDGRVLILEYRLAGAPPKNPSNAKA